VTENNVVPFRRKSFDSEHALRWSDGRLQTECSEHVHIFAMVPGRCRCGERWWNPETGTTDLAPTFKPSA
jgi:hypothetical protein